MITACHVRIDRLRSCLRPVQDCNDCNQNKANDGDQNVEVVVKEDEGSKEKIQ